MSQLPVYMLANLTIQDEVKYRDYAKGFFPILKRHEGEFITYDDNPHHFEGSAPRAGRVILFKFPSEAHARRWYEDPDYQAISEHRRAGTKLEFLTMIHSLPPRT